VSARHLAVVAAILVFARTARAQETFGAGDVDQAAPAPAPAPAAPPAPGDEWWRKRPEVVVVPAVASPRVPKPMALRLDGAYAPRRLFALGVGGADLGFGLGVQTAHHVAWWWTTRASLGSTENGLRVWSGRMGAEVEAVYDPIRFGIGASLLMMGVDRAARDRTLNSYGVEGRAFVRFDCWRTDDAALFLRAGIDGAVETKSGSAFWGPGIGAGVELGVRGKKRPEWEAAAPPIPRM
jgi:hypothetical protein